MPSSNNNIIGELVPVLALAPVTPSSSTPTRISLKNALSVTVVVSGLNATTVTGSAITLKQSSDVSGTGEKALSFDTVWQNTDTAAADGFAKTTVSSDTFTTTSTNSKSYVYIVEVPIEAMDTNNGFDCFRVGAANATATTLQVMYYVKSRSTNATGTPTLLTN